MTEVGLPWFGYPGVEPVFTKSVTVTVTVTVDGWGEPLWR